MQATQFRIPCNVVSVKTTKDNLSFAHLQLGMVWADCPCDSDVVVGEAKLRITFKAYQGRLQPSLRVITA